MRDRLSQAMKDAMKSGDKRRLGTIRLILAAIKDRDLGIGAGGAVPAGDKISDGEILALLQKMIKQRRDSIATYQQGGRQDLADQEAAEIVIIEEFLPKQMDEAEMTDAITKVVAELGAHGFKDMGRVMGAVKERFTGRMDMGKASGIVKGLLK
jgi:hypothetical protein